jgi:hypothetical protein
MASTKEPDKEPEVICSICGKTISVEDGKTDDNGAPVHGDCYIHKMLRESWLRAHWE